MAEAVHKVEDAADSRSPLLVSTPNLNFLVNSLSDSEFRASLLDSDLCLPDGMPIVWIARLLGLPIGTRAAGADLFDQLQQKRARRLTAFLFGGAHGVASAAAIAINSKSNGMTCVGTMNPGFGDVNEMSQDYFIDVVNSSGADILILSLGAKKGQLWLQRNHHRLTIPVRSHLGAALNFQAGTVKRAPAIVRSCGFEWLWRIKEEHYLWRRYLDDGLVLVRLLVTRVLPLAVITRWQRFVQPYEIDDLLIKKDHDGRSILIHLCGFALERNIAKASSCFEEALRDKQDIVVDLSNTRLIDARFLGLLLMLRKELKSRGANLVFTGVSSHIGRIFRLSELEFLLPNVQPG